MVKKLPPVHLNKQVALITGANSGLGFEAAAQMAEAGVGRVILGCRNRERAEEAKARLIERTGKDVFSIVIIDTSDLKSSEAAAAVLAEQEGKLDLVVLNAGGSVNGPTQSVDDLEMVLAMNVFGHHVLTMKLLEAGKLADDAHIIMAGSEGSRGEMGMMKLFDYDSLKQNFGGDLDATLDAVARGEQPTRFNSNSAYVNAKLWGIWWAAILAEKVPEGMVVMSVSPGSAPGTNAIKKMPLRVRWTLGLMMKVMGPLMKMAGPVNKGSRRYLDAANFAADAAGKFWASPPKKLVGPMQVQEHSHFKDRKMQAATWDAIVRTTRTDLNLPV